MSTASESHTCETGVKPPRELVSSPSFLLKRLGFEVKERVLRRVRGRRRERRTTSPSSRCWTRATRETQATIADALSYDRSYLVGLLDELEERGLIERNRDPADRRRHIVRVTPAGKKSSRSFARCRAAIDDEFFAPLSADERATLHALLHKPRGVPRPAVRVERARLGCTPAADRGART